MNINLEKFILPHQHNSLYNNVILARTTKMPGKLHNFL
jgi:hypothetical protein